MPDILHRFTVDAPPEQVHELIATPEGLERWWTAHTNVLNDATLRIFFGGKDPAAVMQIVEVSTERVVWRVAGGPADWIDTTITFALNSPCSAPDLRTRQVGAPVGAAPVHELVGLAPVAVREQQRRAAILAPLSPPTLPAR
jgi:hypothetical protein